MIALAAVAALTLSALTGPDADGRAADVSLHIDARGGIVVAVEVNGTGPYLFLLDTGSSRSIVSDALARELGAPAVAKSEVVSNAGTDVRMVVSLASVAVSGVRVANLLAPVIPAKRLDEAGSRVRGVLGQDFLSAFNYTLDYRHARLRWDEPLTCSGPDAVPLVFAEGRFVMLLEAGSESPLRLVPDSGADAPVLFTRSRPRAAVSRIRTLRLGAISLADLPAVNVERVDPNADGLLPLHHFSEVSFASGGRCLVVRR